MATLDVRPDLAAGREPFSKIMEALGQLDPSEALEVIAPFEPLPLYAVMAEKGYRHEMEVLPDGGWKVTFKQ